MNVYLVSHCLILSRFWSVRTESGERRATFQRTGETIRIEDAGTRTAHWLFVLMVLSQADIVRLKSAASCHSPRGLQELGMSSISSFATRKTC